jgi:dihydrolipoamide dehydrogenase
MFVDPLVSGVGPGEKQLQQSHTQYQVAAFHYSLVSRALAKGIMRQLLLRNITLIGKPSGYMKMMVTNEPQPKILGVRAVGTHAATIISIISFMIKTKSDLSELTDLMMGYPSVTEGLQECARLFYGTSILKPSVFPGQVQYYKVTYDKGGVPLYQSGVPPYTLSKTRHSLQPWQEF